jgi:hypothetical protein
VYSAEQAKRGYDMASDHDSLPDGEALKACLSYEGKLKVKAALSQSLPFATRPV